MNMNEPESGFGMVKFVIDLVRNVSVFMLAQIFSRVVSFIYMLFLAASLPTSTFGALNIALTVLVVADVFADMGLSRLVVRTLSRDHSLLRIYPGKVILLRLILALLAFTICVAAVGIKDFGPEVSTFIMIIGAGLLVTGASSVLEAVLQSQSSFGIIGIGHVGLSLVQAATGYWVVSAGEGSAALAMTFLVSNLAFMVLLLSGVLYRHGFGAPAFVPHFWRSQLALSLPYAGTAILGIIAMRGELLVMSWLSKAEEVAFFSVAARLNDAAILGPLILATVLIPQFSRYHHDVTGALTRSYGTVLRWGLIIAIPACMTAALLVEPVLLYLLPAYLASSQLTALLFAAMPFFAVYQLNGAVFLSSDDQNRTMWVLALFLTVQLIVCVLLVKEYAAIGAAIGYAFWTFLAAVGSTLLARRWYMKDIALVSTILPPLVGVLTMGLILLATRGMPLPVKMVGALSAYAFSVVATLWFEQRGNAKLVQTK